MADERIALIIDSGTDVPPEYVTRYHMYTLPLLINYRDGSYRDQIDITPEEVYRRFDEEIPTTSLPSPLIMQELFERIIADGYEKAVVVTLSSGLSATHDTVKMIAKQYPALESVIIDTKNIGIGAGFTAIAAGELIEQGVPFDELEERLQQIASDTKIFFSVETLEYLKAGGRIGEVTYLMGSLLDIKPIITCNEKGVYHTVQKARGRKQALNKALALARKMASGFKKYNVAVVHGGAEEEADEILSHIHEHFPLAERVFKGQISPALVVHTGPGLIGIGVQGISRP